MRNIYFEERITIILIFYQYLKVMSGEVDFFDYIVVGAGINGSWTAYHLSKRGFKVLLLDQVRIRIRMFEALHGHYAM